jgi:hypothetical protein
VFAAERPLAAPAAAPLLAAVDDFLARWARTARRCARRAPGATTASSPWRSTSAPRTPRVARSTGCSARSGRSSPSSARRSSPAGRVYWRDPSGAVRSGDRAALRAAAGSGAVGPATPVFDTTVATAGDWRARFERPLGESWHARVAGLAAPAAGAPA